VRAAVAAEVPLSSAYDRYLRCLDDADEYGAIDVALDLMARDVPAETVLLELVAPAQAQIGQWWQSNRWSIAQEHAATHVSDRVVAAVASAARRPATLERVVVACMDGEWHALPARLVAEVLRLRGWDVTFLGASVPAAHLVSYLHRHDPRAVALGCALPMRLPHASRMIQACRRADVPILVGGRAFGPDGRWAARLGVPWASDALAAADLLADDRALEAWSGPDTTVDPESTQDEYVSLVNARAELIEFCLEHLRATVPATASYTPAQRDATLADLGHILDALSAAVYVDDADLFLDFVAWLGEVLASRRVPLRSVSSTLDALGDRLRDYPRAQRFLRAAPPALHSAIL
jgi:methanogenic corrinoid protein MtbC1